ncbi:MAG: hypothetical protein RBR86_07745 [Pseudobdellovibrionaceae bacterium]|jgi:hypothetical protein|nr:hypothetical protein [Pseudobdellovibrionaceae bacterium]
MNKALALKQLGEAFYYDRYEQINPSGMLDKAVAMKDSVAYSQEQVAALSRKIDAAPNVSKVISSITEQSTDVEAFSAALVKKLKQDPQLIEKLEKELVKNPELGKQLADKIVKNQAAASQDLMRYNGSNLQAIVSPGQPTPAPTPTTTAPAKQPNAAPQGTKPTQPTKPAAAPTTAAPVAAPADPAVTPTKPAVDIPKPPEDAFTVQTMGKQIYNDILTKSDADVSKMIDPSFVKGMAAGMATMAVDKFGVDEAKAHGFAERVGGDPKLQEAIANNLKEHPDFVRNLAKMANDDSQVPDSVRQTAKKELERIMEKPELLASDDYVNGLNGKLQMAGGLNKFASMFENMFGVDMKGMMSNVGEFFQGFIQKIMDFIGNLTGNPNMVSGSNMALGMTQNLHHSMYEKQSMRVLPDERGQLFHEVKNGNSTYKEQNTIEVQGANGTAVRIIPTDGAVKLSEKANGEVRLRVAASYDDEGRVRYTRDVSLSKEGYEQYKAQVAMRGANEPVREPPKREPMQTAYLDPKSGMEVPDPTIRPQQQGPGYTDPNLTKKLMQNPDAAMQGMGMGLST